MFNLGCGRSCPQKPWRRTSMEEAGREIQRAGQLHILEELLRAIDDPHEFLAIALPVTDGATVQRALQEQFGLDDEQARVAIFMQFRLMTGQGRQLIREEATALRG